MTFRSSALPWLLACGVALCTAIRAVRRPCLTAGCSRWISIREGDWSLHGKDRGCCV